MTGLPPSMAARSHWRNLSWFHLALGAWFLAVAVVCVRVGSHPGSHSAFTVCRDAGATWLQQGEIYGLTTGFLYSPLIAALYAPFALLPAGLAEVLWRLLIGFSLPLALWLSSKELFHFGRKKFGYLLLLSMPLTLSNLNNGQANLILLALLLLAAAAALQERWWLCAFTASFAVYWKIYPIAFAILLLLVFPKKLCPRLLVCLVGLFVLSLLLQNPGYAWHEYGSWLDKLTTDRRREVLYYGKNRDFYLLLRIVGLPISATWWKALQLTAAGIAAAICLLGVIRRWPLPRLVFGVLAVAIAWMLLFGPATEATTYVLIAAPSACLLILGWSADSSQSLRITSTVTYFGFILADILNSWLHIKRNVHLVHAVQPAFTLCFCVALFFWWKQYVPREVSGGPGEVVALGPPDKSRPGANGPTLEQRLGDHLFAASLSFNGWCGQAFSSLVAFHSLL